MTLKKVVSATSVALLGFSVSQALAETGTSSSKIQQQLASLEAQVQALQKQEEAQVKSSPHLAHQTNQLSRGFIGVDWAKNVNFEEDYPSTTFEIALLRNKASYPATLTLGGTLEHDIQYWNGNDSLLNGQGNGSGAYLTTFKLDTLYNMNDWVMAFTTLQSAGDPSLSIAKAFVTFGNLQKLPLYLSVGKDYVPFGVFGGNGPWSNELVKTVFRPGEMPQIIVGYDHAGLNTSLSFFNNDTNNAPQEGTTPASDNGSPRLSGFVYSANYAATEGNINYTLGASYLNNLAATNSFLGAAAARNTSTSSGANLTDGVVPVYDVNASLSYEEYSLLSEFVSTTKTLRNQTDKSRGWYVAGGYAPTIVGKVTTFGLSFSQLVHVNNISGQPLPMLANPSLTTDVGMQRSWIASVSREIFPHVVSGLEWAQGVTFNGQSAYSVTLDTSLYF